MLRKFLAIFMMLVLSWTTVACGSAPTETAAPSRDRPAVTQTRQFPKGRYPVQQATYDDADGTYSLLLLDTPPGVPALYRSANLQLARLTDEQITQGQKPALEVDGDQAVLYLTEDFRIEYVHNVTETKPDPQTGGTQSVVVRQESSFWSPFAGALAGQALGNLLFAPRYYVPPIYQSGGLRGFGGQRAVVDLGRRALQGGGQGQTSGHNPQPKGLGRLGHALLDRARAPGFLDAQFVRVAQAHQAKVFGQHSQFSPLLCGLSQQIQSLQEVDRAVAGAGHLKGGNFHGGGSWGVSNLVTCGSCQLPLM
jgi:hypothetical protein